MIPKFRAFVKSGTKQMYGGAYEEDAMVPVGVLDITGGEVTVWGCGIENCGMCDDYFRIKDIILMQYTGLKDKNGVEIYEGDVVKGYSVYPTASTFEPFLMGEVYYTNRGTWDCYSYILGGFNEQVEVIGNIYEDSNLIK